MLSPLKPVPGAAQPKPNVRKTLDTSEAWRNRPIERGHPYVYLDGIVLKRSWPGEARNVSLLVAIGVNSEGYREILGICEGAKEDRVAGAPSSNTSRSAGSTACG